MKKVRRGQGFVPAQDVLLPLLGGRVEASFEGQQLLGQCFWGVRLVKEGCTAER